MYLDINKEIRTNGQFADTLFKKVRAIEELETKAAETMNFQSAIQERILDLAKFCNYNLGITVPYFFPQYPDEKPPATRTITRRHIPPDFWATRHSPAKREQN